MANRDAFVDYIWPHAVAASEATGVDPRIIAGQAAVESGWGQHFVGNNLFGIKGPGTLAQSPEYVGGQPTIQTSSFRNFATPADSVAGYADFINSNPRYTAFRNADDTGTQLTALQRSGYATDPQYAGKVANAAAAIDATVRKQSAPNWQGRPGEGMPTDIGTALGYTGTPAKAAAVSDSGSDFFKDMGLDPNAKNKDEPTTSIGGQGGDFFKDMGIIKPPEARAVQGASKEPAIPTGDPSAAVGQAVFDLPVVGPYVQSGVAKGVAAVRALQHDTPYSQELANVQDFMQRTKAANPNAYIGGQVLGTSAALLPLASTGLGAAALGARAPAFITQAEGLLPAAARLGSQAAAGGASNALVSGADAYIRGEDPLRGGAIGGAVGAAAPAVGIPLMAAGRGIAAAIEPFSSSGQQAIADRIIGGFAKGGPMSIQDARLGNVPGSVPTLAEATQNPGLASLQRGAESVRPNPFEARKVERGAAREDLTSGLKGDQASLENLIADRQAATDPLREAAFANAGKADASNVVGKIDEILKGPEGQRDAVVKTLGAIRNKIVKSGGGSADPMAAITGGEAKPPTLESDPNQLYGIRKAIGDILDRTGPKTENDARLASSQLMDVKGELDKSIEGAASGFKDYLSTYAETSKPIDTQKYLQGLNLTDTRGKITLGNVDRAIKSTEKARAAGGANEAKSIPDDVMGQLYKLRDDLRGQQSVNDLGRPAGSNTFQNFATNNIASQLGMPLTWAGALTQNPTLAFGAHLLNQAYKSKNEAIMDAVVNRLLTPEVPGTAAFARALPGGQTPNIPALLAPGVISPNRNRLLP